MCYLVVLPCLLLLGTPVAVLLPADAGLLLLQPQGAGSPSLPAQVRGQLSQVTGQGTRGLLGEGRG